MPNEAKPGAIETTAIYRRESRQSLARTVSRLFDNWELSNRDRMELLGMPRRSTSVLSRYRQGQPLPPTGDLIERVGHLLAIHKAPRVYFPRNRELAYRWMSSENDDFGGFSPIQVIRRVWFSWPAIGSQVPGPNTG
jgi:hypothetical protein